MIAFLQGTGSVQAEKLIDSILDRTATARDISRRESGRMISVEVAL